MSTRKRPSTRRTKKEQRRPARAPNFFPLMNKVSTSNGHRPVIPPETDVLLSFQVNKVINNAASTTAMVRFIPNAAYDVDPILGSTNTPGFAEWASFYNYYRVIKVGTRIELANNEAFPVRVYTVYTNTDPGTVGNLQFPGNTMAKSFLLSAKGGQDRCVLSDTKTVATIVGTPGVEQEDNFRAAVTTSPVDLVYQGIGANSIGIAFLPNGVTCCGVIRMFVRFYDVKALFL